MNSEAAEWISEFDVFISSDFQLETDILNIDEPEKCQSDLLESGLCTLITEKSSTICKDFKEECSTCCICWEPFLSDKELSLFFLEKKQVMTPFVLPCLHLGHLCCLKKMLTLRCIQKCCGRCAMPVPEQLFGTEFMALST
jgi:hypothetical protein